MDVRAPAFPKKPRGRRANRIVTLPDDSKLPASLAAELAALQAMPDHTIDTSDIPPLTEAFWTHAVRNPLYKPVKQSTTVRIDSDVLVWLKSQGKGYQTRINTILRREMLAAIQAASAKNQRTRTRPAT